MFQVPVHHGAPACGAATERRTRPRPVRIVHRLLRAGGSATVSVEGQTLVDRPTRLARRSRSATVSVEGQTLVDLPTRLAGEGGADRPPSATNRGGSTTVTVRTLPLNRAR